MSSSLTASAVTRTAPLQEVRAGWRALAAATVGVGLGVSPLGATYTLGLFVPSLQRAFGWSRAEIFGVNFAMLAAVLPASYLVGAAADRIGIRRMVLLSQLGLGLGFIAIGMLSANLLSFYALFFLLAVLGAGTLPITFARAVAARFSADRGFALGVALAGTGLCGLLVPNYVAWAVAKFGWRLGYVAVAALPLLIALPLSALWLREGSPAQEPATRPSTPSSAAGLTLGAALRSWRFWLMGLAFFGVSGAVTGALSNLTLILRDQGFPTAGAAGLLSLFGLSVIFGRLVVGYLVDRFWAPLVGAVLLAPTVVALFALSHAHLGGAAVVACIVCVGLATGAEIDLNAYLVSRYFGLRSFGRIYGLQYALTVTAAAMGGPIFGAAYDSFGSYAPVLRMAAVAVLATIAGLLLLGRYPAATPEA